DDRRTFAPEEPVVAGAETRRDVPEGGVEPTVLRFLVRLLRKCSDVVPLDHGSVPKIFVEDDPGDAPGGGIGGELGHPGGASVRRVAHPAPYWQATVLLGEDEKGVCLAECCGLEAHAEVSEFLGPVVPRRSHDHCLVDFGCGHAGTVVDDLKCSGDAVTHHEADADPSRASRDGVVDDVGDGALERMMRTDVLSEGWVRRNLSFSRDLEDGVVVHERPASAFCREVRCRSPGPSSGMGVKWVLGVAVGW